MQHKCKIGPINKKPPKQVRRDQLAEFLNTTVPTSKWRDISHSETGQPTSTTERAAASPLADSLNNNNDDEFAWLVEPAADPHTRAVRKLMTILKMISHFRIVTARALTSSTLLSMPSCLAGAQLALVRNKFDCDCVCVCVSFGPTSKGKAQHLLISKISPGLALFR